MKTIKDEFPIFKNHQELVFLDNASTTQKPNILIDALGEYYSNYNSNVGRGIYKLAEVSENKYQDSKENIKKFFKGSKYELLVTSGSTESLNIAAHISTSFNKKKYIVIPFFEHHANILIWQSLAKKLNLEIFWIKDLENFESPSEYLQGIKEEIAVIALTHVSNVTGELIPIKAWIDYANDINAISVIDGSQSVTSLLINLNELNCDFFAFSAHKLYGPMGLGFLFMKPKFLNSEPLKLGGGIIEDVTLDNYELTEGVNRFEAGTPNVANTYAFSKVLDWLSMNQWDALLQNSKEITKKLYLELENINIKPIVLSPNFNKTHICSFNIPNIHPHDVGTFLSNKNIAVRVGKHCAYPLHQQLNLNSSVRASIGIYNNDNDIDYFINTIKDVKKYFK